MNGHVTVGKGRFTEFAEASGEMSEAAYEDFLRITIGNMMKAVKPGGVLFICIDWRHVEALNRHQKLRWFEALKRSPPLQGRPRKPG